MRFKIGDRVLVRNEATCWYGWKSRIATVVAVEKDSLFGDYLLSFSEQGTLKADTCWFNHDQIKSADPRVALDADVRRAVKAFEAAREALLALGCKVEATITSPPEVRTYK